MANSNKNEMIGITERTIYLILLLPLVPLRVNGMLSKYMFAKRNPRLWKMVILIGFYIILSLLLATFYSFISHTENIL